MFLVKSPTWEIQMVETSDAEEKNKKCEKKLKKSFFWPREVLILLMKQCLPKCYEY